MKIAIDIRHLASPNPSGIGRYTLEMIPRLAKLAPQIDFLLFASGSEKSLQYIPSFPAKNITVQKKEMPNRLLSFYLKSRPNFTLDKLLAYPVDGWWFPNANIIRTNLPYILTIHDLSFEFFPEFYSLKTRAWHKACNIERLAKQAKKLIAVSESTRQDLQIIWNIHAKNIDTIHLGVADNFSPKKEKNDRTNYRKYGIRTPYFLTLSTIEPRKNIESVIEAFLDWKRITGSPHRLVIAGKKGFQAKRILKRATNDILHIDYVAEKDKPALYRQAEGFIFPSYYEGFGLPVIESIKSGTPVICSDNSSLPEITNGQAILVNPYNISAIQQALSIVTTSLPSPHKISFSWEESAHKTLKTFKSLLP